jgi:hypothetical protein
MSLRTTASLLALSGSFALVACGSEETSTESGAAARSSAERALAEIGNVRTSLDDAVAAVRRGDRAKADEILAEGYVEHFEIVEHPLEEVDPALKEELEETLATKLRDEVKRGASAAEVQALAEDAKADLDTAEGKLR